MAPRRPALRAHRTGQAPRAVGPARAPVRPGAGAREVALPPGGEPGARAPRGAEDHVELGRVSRPHGTRGAVRVQLHNPASEALADARTVRLVLPDGASEERRVRASYPASRGAVVLELAGSDTVESAELLRGAAVSLPRTELAPTAEGEFYACDLEGCRVLFAGEPIGTVVRVAFYPSCEVLIIARSAGGELEVPLLDGFVAGVDLGARTVELRSLGDLA